MSQSIGVLQRSALGALEKAEEARQAYNDYISALAEREPSDEEKGKIKQLSDTADSLRAKALDADKLYRTQKELAEPIESYAGLPLSPKKPGDGINFNYDTQARVSHNLLDPNGKINGMWGFRSPGEFITAIIGQTAPHRLKSNQKQAMIRFQDLSAHILMSVAPDTFSSDQTLADGGALVPPDMAELWNLKVASAPISKNLDAPIVIRGNALTIPINQVPAWGTISGAQSEWLGPGERIDSSKIQLTNVNIPLKKLVSLMPVAEELLSEVTGLERYLMEIIGNNIAYKHDTAYLKGSGNMDPQGFLSSGNGSLITVAPQAANTLAYTDILKMKQRLLDSGDMARKFWVVHPFLETALRTMTTPGGTFFVFQNNIEGVQNDRIFAQMLGIPIVFTPIAPPPGQPGCISLVNAEGYKRITRAMGGMDFQSSAHLYFDAGAIAFRATTFTGGRNLLNSPILDPNNQKGTNANLTYSYFVMLGANSISV